MKTTRLLKATAVIATFLLTVNMQAKVIADFVADYSPIAKSGWSYQWNPTGVSLGKSAAYEDLFSAPDVYYYSVEPKGDAPVDWNEEWIKLSTKSILPGRPAEKSTDQISHYVIIAYTVQQGKSGEARIVNSQIKRVLRGVERPPSPISIYVNERLIGSDAVKGYEVLHLMFRLVA